MIEIECNHCKNDTEKRKLVQRVQLTKIYESNDYIEFYCSNTIKKRKLLAKRKDKENLYIWNLETCRNNILVKKIKKGD